MELGDHRNDHPYRVTVALKVSFRRDLLGLFDSLRPFWYLGLPVSGAAPP